MPNNIWRWKAVDKDGKPVESAPGLPTFTSRGPASRKDMIYAATLLLNSKRMDAMQVGEPDPGYRIVEDSIEPLGNSDDPAGLWVATGGKPLDLPTDARVRAHDEKLIAEKLGINAEAR